MDSSLRWNDEVERLVRVKERPERSEESCSTSKDNGLSEAKKAVRPAKTTA
jgi:hypothetical protein